MALKSFILFISVYLADRRKVDYSLMDDLDFSPSSELSVVYEEILFSPMRHSVHLIQRSKAEVLKPVKNFWKAEGFSYVLNSSTHLPSKLLFFLQTEDEILMMKGDLQVVHRQAISPLSTIIFFQNNIEFIDFYEFKGTEMTLHRFTLKTIRAKYFKELSFTTEVKGPFDMSKYFDSKEESIVDIRQVQNNPYCSIIVRTQRKLYLFAKKIRRVFESGIGQGLFRHIQPY